MSSCRIKFYLKEIRKLKKNIKDLLDEDYFKEQIKNKKKNNSVFEENQINCNYIECAAGTGISGNGKCFLHGNGKKDCPEFINEEDFLNPNKR